MPIRINLLAEQQAAEEARRKDPIKRALIIGGACIVVTALWILMLYVNLKAKRAELVNLDLAFKRVDEQAKVVKKISTDAGDIEQRIASLEKYSTNRVLWASMLEALQKVTMDQIYLKSVSTVQRYPQNPAFEFFSTTVHVPYTPPPPVWKFWAGPAAATPIFTMASNLFKTFTNAPPFHTNKLPYKVKMAVTLTNLQANTVAIECKFELPAVCTEDIEVVISGRDYAGNPPGASLDEFQKQVEALPYFKDRLAKTNDAAFMSAGSRPEADLTVLNSPMFRKFDLKLKFENRILINE